MKYTLQNIIAGLFLFFGVFLSSAGIAQADTMNLPQEFQQAGLVFTQPLTYLTNDQFPHRTVSFSLSKQIVMIPHYQKLTTDMPLPTIAEQISILPLPTATPTPTPTDTPTPTIEIIASATPTSPPMTPNTNTGGLDPEKLFSMSNAYRQSLGLASFQKDDRACSLAASRAPEVGGEIASGTMHAGLKARALPYWNTENIISMNSEAAAFAWWINDKIHHDAIVGNFKYSCVACSGNSCAQEFTNFQPK